MILCNFGSPQAKGADSARDLVEWWWEKSITQTSSNNATDEPRRCFLFSSMALVEFLELSETSITKDCFKMSLSMTLLEDEVDLSDF